MTVNNRLPFLSDDSVRATGEDDQNAPECYKREWSQFADHFFDNSKIKRHICRVGFSELCDRFLCGNTYDVVAFVNELGKVGVA